MNLQTNLSGRLRNTTLPVTGGLLPLFEAVVNSIHAIEEADLPMDKGRIVIDIERKLRESQLNFEDASKPGPDPLADILGFKVIDNGVGFTDDNMCSFSTLDSEHKANKGCRGIGRLLWLKAFNNVTVDSSFFDSAGTTKRRTFRFDTFSGVSQETLAVGDEGAVRQTIIVLRDFVPRYREYARKTPRAIADCLFEHCLWYFVRPGSAPHIEIRDNGEVICLTDVFEEHMVASAQLENVDIKGRSFDLVHVKLRTNNMAAHTIAYCADSRLVMEEKLASRVPGLQGRLSDENGEFIYSCYVSSPFLDQYARPERTGFDIMDKVEGLLEQTEISLEDIRSTVVYRAATHLSDHIAAQRVKSKERIRSFTATKAPRYRPILSRIPEEQLNIDPDCSDKELELFLHKQLTAIENELLSEGHDVMERREGELFADYASRIQKYLDMAEDVKKSDLANYVSHRRVILDLLEKAIQRDENGHYVREDLIHRLIMPMGIDSTEIIDGTSNLWLIDERMAFHDYLASDKTLRSMPITGSSETKEPDLCLLNVCDTPLLVSEGSRLPLAALTVVEIKRPMRDDAKEGEDHDPIEQAIGYVCRIRDGGVTTANGRPIPTAHDVPGFCYILADLTKTLVKRCVQQHDLKRTADGLGYFGYKSNCNAFIEVISFDRLLNAAKERNRAFFDKLGLPSN